MESAPAPVEEVHTLAPENLPPEMAPRTAFNPKIFDRARKIEIVAELMQSGLPTSKMAAKVSADSGCIVTAPQLRGWSNAYASEATKLLKARNAERLLGPPIPNDTPETRDAYTPGERRKILAQYHASGLGLEAGAQAVGVKHDTLRKWLAAEAAAKKPYPTRKAIAGPGANISDKTREAALEKLVAGIGVETVAHELLVSPKSIRVWYFKKFGKKLEAREIKRAAKMADVKQAKEPARRRLFTEKEKILYAVRYKKLGIDNWEEGARRLEVSPSALREWVKMFEKLKPQQKAAVKIAAHGKISAEVKADAVAAIARGEDWAKVAQDVGVHRDSIKAWYLKTGKKWPSPWAARSKSPNVKAAQLRNPLDPRAPDAVAEIEGGKLISDVSKSLGVMTGTLRTWWRAIKGDKKWPNQYGMRSARRAPSKPYGPQKKTLDRISLREAVLSNSQVITAEMAETAQATQHLNGHAQPISTGKATHDALIFLQLARDEYQKAVKAGKMRVDDPTMLFPMLALHTLSK